MNELVQMVTQKTGISRDKAQQAVEVILNHLKSRLPGPITSHLDQYTGGGSSGSSNLENEAANKLGSMLGGEKKAS